MALAPIPIHTYLGINQLNPVKLSGQTTWEAEESHTPLLFCAIPLSYCFRRLLEGQVLAKIEVGKGA